MIRTPTPARVKGTVRFYSPEEGRGIIATAAGDYHFSVTDVVGTLGPQLGDRVAFSGQLVREQQFARKVVLERNPQYIDGIGPRRTLDFERPSPRPGDSRPAGGRKSLGRSHVQCQGCSRWIVPRQVRARGLLRLKSAPVWRRYCPHCNTRQIEIGRDAPRLARLLLGLLFVGLLIGGGLTLL